MPFGHYSVPHKGCLHFRQSNQIVYVGFLLPHLCHLGSLLINLREAKRLSLPHLLHCPRAQLLKTEWKPPKALDFPKAVFSNLPRADNMRIFMLLPSLLPGLCMGLAQLFVPAGLATCSVPRAGLPL